MKKRLLLIILAIGLLVLGVNFITRGEYLSGRLKAYVIDEARVALGYDVGVDRLVFNFFPAYVDLYAPNVKGWDPADPEAAVRADKVRVYFSLAALMNKELIIRRVQLYTPELEVIRRPSGALNIDPLVEKVTSIIENEDVGEYKTSLHEVVLLGARLAYSDPEQGVRIETKDAGLDLRIKDDGGFGAAWKAGDVIARSPGTPEFHISCGGEMQWEEGTAHVERFNLTSEGTKMRVSGSVTPSERPVLDLALDGRIDLRLLERLALIKEGPTGSLKVEGMVKGAYPKLSGQGSVAISDLGYAGMKVDDVRSDIDFAGTAVKFSRISGVLLGGTVDGDLSLELGGEEVSWSSSLVMTDLVSGRFTETREDLRFIPWYWVSADVELSGRGLDISGVSGSGKAGIRRYTLRHEAPNANKDLAIIKDVSVGFRLKDEKVLVESGNVRSDGAEINFNGSVGFDGEAGLVIKGHATDISEIASIIGYDRLTGKADLTGYMEGNIVEPVIHGKGQITDAYADGIHFKSAHGDLELRDWRLNVRNFEIVQNYGRFTLNGVIAFKGPGASFDSPFYEAVLSVKEADARKITAIFYEDIPVNLFAEGELKFRGTAEDFEGEAHLVTGKGDVYGQKLDRSEVRAVLTNSKISFPEVVAIRDRDIVTASGWIGFDGTFKGEASSPRFDLGNFNLFVETGVPVKGSMSFSVKGSGSFDDPLIALKLTPYKLLLKDVDLGAGSINARIKDSRLGMEGEVLEGRVALKGELGLSAPYPWKGSLSFDGGRFEPFIRMLYPELPEDVSLTATGTMSGDGKLDELASTSVKLKFSRLSASMMGRRFENVGDVSLSYLKGGLTIGSLKFAGEEVSFEVTGGAESLEKLNLRVSASTDLVVFRKFVDESVDYLDGKVSLKLKATGDISGPNLYGTASVSGAGIKFKEFPQRFEDIDARFVFDGPGFTLESMRASLGGGIITASGTGALRGTALDSFSLTLKAEGVKVKYPESLTSTVNSSLSIEGVRGNSSITGEIVIAKARYTERVDWKSWLLQFEAGREEIRTRDLGALGNTALNVAIRGDESIKIDNNVAKITVSTDLLLRGTINRPVLVGRFESSGGKVFLRNHAFNLVNGVAEFADPSRLNPIIDLQGETRVREYLIQLTLSGTVDRIRVTLLSDPPLEDADIISLLTLGRTSGGIAGHESALTTGEAASFVTGRIQDVVEERVSRLTGFDRFQISPYLTSTGTTTGTRLTVGKTLFSEKLYITFSTNLATSEEQFIRLEYIVNKNFSLIGERDELGRIGGDLKFRFMFR